MTHGFVTDKTKPSADFDPGKSTPFVTDKTKPSIGEIDRRRRARGVSIDTLAAAAGTTTRTYLRAIAGVHQPRRATLGRLAAALDRGVVSRRACLPLHIIASLHRMVMENIAAELGLDPAVVLATDFSRQRPMDKAWLAAARVRRQAIAVLALDVGIARAHVAGALGVTKQNVAVAIRQVYDLSDADHDVEARLTRLAKSLNG